MTEFVPGDAVIGFPGAGFGAHAEASVMPADGKLVRKPADVDFEHAAAIPFGATTAYDVLVNKAGVKAGETVLVNGASGATGSACVQIAKDLVAIDRCFAADPQQAALADVRFEAFKELYRALGPVKEALGQTP